MQREYKRNMSTGCNVSIGNNVSIRQIGGADRANSTVYAVRAEVVN